MHDQEIIITEILSFKINKKTYLIAIMFSSLYHINVIRNLNVSMLRHCTLRLHLITSYIIMQNNWTSNYKKKKPKTM